MIFESKIHGKIEYSEDNIITLKKTLLGFEKLKKFILIDLKEYEPFKLFQSLENDETGLIVVSPFEFFDDYEMNLSEDVIDRLQIKDFKDVILVTTVTLNSNVEKITTNLRAPIVINSSNKFGEQMILDNLEYNIKQPLRMEM